MSGRFPEHLLRYDKESLEVQKKCRSRPAPYSGAGQVRHSFRQVSLADKTAINLYFLPFKIPFILSYSRL